MTTKDRNVSWSEIQAWCTCRAKWDWSYRVGIVPVRVERAPSVGSCGHAAVAALLRGEDWAAAVQVWLKAELGKRKMFDEEVAEVRAVADTVAGIMPRYAEHYQDKFEVVLVEHRFEVPIRGIRARLIGYWDAIVRDAEGKLWLAEHKFPARGFRSDEDLDLDGQVGVYQYAAHRLGFPVVGTIFNQILGRLPAEPKTNKDGTLSRAKVYTDWETYRAFAVKRGLNPADYAEMQEKLFDMKFFQRNYIYRPPVEVKTFARDMERRIWDMRGNKRHVYRSESFLVCGRCPYRELCLETVKGGDVDGIIATQFEPKKSREEEYHGYQADPTTEPDPAPGA